MGKVSPELHERLGNLIVSMGYELVGCEILPQGRQMIFRIYIDGSDGKSVTVEDCSRVSHQVSAMMDVLDAIQGRYFLEVSSPGINRPLFEIGHYRKVIGKSVKIKLHAPIDQRRQFTGVLQRVEGEDIYLLVEGLDKEVIVPFSAIEKGNLVGEFHF